jgi:hypothetical protein
MKRKIILAAVLCLAVAALGIGAAPALATSPLDTYPVTMTPGVAYVHPWGDPAYWEEVVWESIKDPESGALVSELVWHGWDTDTTPGPYWPGEKEEDPPIPWHYKAIPSSYDVWFVAWVWGGPPRGQYVAMPGNLRLWGSLTDAAGDTVWSTTVKQAKKLWGPAFQWPGWTLPTFNKGEQEIWAIVWTYVLDPPLGTGTYSGEGNYLFKHQMTDQGLYDDEQRGPVHFDVKGIGSTFPGFTITVVE